jgi:hypothetical protein
MLGLVVTRSLMPAPRAGLWPGTRPVSLDRDDLGHTRDTERLSPQW